MSTSLDHFSQKRPPTPPAVGNGLRRTLSLSDSSSESQLPPGFHEFLKNALKRDSVPTSEHLEHAQNIWSSISGGSLPADTPPPEDISEAYFNNAGNQSSTPVSESEPPLVAVIGVGYVGMQLVTSFADHYNVVAFDVSEKRMNTIRLELANYPSVTCTTDPGSLAGVTHFLISVPTTLLPDKRIDTSFLQSAIYTVGLYARLGATVVVESSVAVGMTRRLLSQLMHVRGLKAGMSPERVDPGRTEPPIQAIPKIISGLDDITPGSLSSIANLYAPVFHSLIRVSSPEVAEMTKLYENCQRMVCIAYANEMADACRTLNISPYEVCAAAASKPFGYVPYTPGLGVGGHCIPVNPYYLLSNSSFPLLQAATERMWGRPAQMGDQLMESLINSPPHSPSFAAKPSSPTSYPASPCTFLSPTFQSSPTSPTSPTSPSSQRAKIPRILVVGLGFKRGQSNLSHSPALALARHLLDRWDAHVTFADPLVSEDAIPYVPRLDERTEWTRDYLIASFEVVVVVMRQVGLDFEVLEGLEKDGGVRVVWYC